jgi:DNA-directed RNA polymerase specialized sigma24 family protein
MALTFARDDSQNELMGFDSAAFDELMRALEPEAVSGKDGYRRYRLRLVKFFLWRRCDDPENLADETTSRLVKNIRSGREITHDHPYRYVYAIATRVFQEYLRMKKKRGIETDIDELREWSTPEKGSENCWITCLGQLSLDKREFLEVYYLDGIDRDQFASKQGLTINALRLKVFRYRADLKRCFENCLKRLNSSRN